MFAGVVRYARAAGISLAYQTWGSGASTLVVIPPLAQNIELMWERSEYVSVLDRLGSFAHVLHFDKRGTGASDRSAQVPTMDERVDDLRAVMDAAGIGRAHLVGVSEGGPVALLFAATYPDRVEGVVLLCSGARLVGDETAEQRVARRKGVALLAERWGTDESLTLALFAPSAAVDPSYVAWEPRYERQSATPAAIRDLLEMMETIDVRPLLGSVDAPTLVLHRRLDRVWPVALAREVVVGVERAAFVELDGVDHFAHVGDTGQWLDEVERFVTGSVTAPVRPHDAPQSRPMIRIMGGFAVIMDGQEVHATAWGSRRARQLCKRLAVALGSPVPREELFDLLWPAEDDLTKLGPRLSVLLSNVRRVLKGGVVADRAAVRLDPNEVDVDLAGVYAALATGDDARAVAAHAGPLLPEDAYEEWAITARTRLSLNVASARRRLATAAASDGRHGDAADHASAILQEDPFDELGHELLVAALVASGRRGDAVRAQSKYEDRMTELGVKPRALLGPDLGVER